MSSREHCMMHSLCAVTLSLMITLLSSLYLFKWDCFSAFLWHGWIQSVVAVFSSTNELNHLNLSLFMPSFESQQIDQSRTKEGVFFTGVLAKQVFANEYQFLNAETLHRWTDNKAICFDSVNCSFLTHPDKISSSCWTLWTKRSPNLETLMPYWTSTHWYVGFPFVLIQATKRVSNWLCCM